MLVLKHADNLEETLGEAREREKVMLEEDKARTARINLHLAELDREHDEDLKAAESKAAALEIRLNGMAPAHLSPDGFGSLRWEKFKNGGKRSVQHISDLRSDLAAEH